MATTVFPESGDSITEAAWTSLNDAMLGGESGREYGLWVTDGGSLDASVSAGVAVIDGQRVNVAAGTTTLTDAATNYVYIDTSGAIADNTSAPGAGTLFLAKVVTSGGSISSVDNHYNLERAAGYGFERTRTVYIRKSADESVNNSTTIQSDDQLYLTGAVGEVWEFTVFMETSVPDYTAGHKLGFSAPSGRVAAFVNMPYSEDDASFLSTGLRGQNESATISDSASLSIHSSVGSTNLDELAMSIRGVWTVGDTGGDLNIQFAQATAYVGNTTVKAGSWLFARRIG